MTGYVKVGDETYRNGWVPDGRLIEIDYGYDCSVCSDTGTTGTDPFTTEPVFCICEKGVRAKRAAAMRRLHEAAQRLDNLHRRH